MSVENKPGLVEKTVEYSSLSLAVLAIASALVANIEGAVGFGVAAFFGFLTKSQLESSRLSPKAA